MKNKLATKLTLKLMALIFVVLIVMIVGSYHVISNTLIEKTKNYNETLAWIMLDSITDEILNNNLSVDSESEEVIHKYCSYVCEWYPIDYAYMYLLKNQNNQQIKLLNYSQKKDGESIFDLNNKAFGNVVELGRNQNLIGSVINHIPTENEKLLLSGEKQGSTQLVNRFFPAYESLVLVKDEKSGDSLVVGLGASQSSINKNIMEKFSPVVIVILIIACFMSCLVYYLIRKSIFQPIKNIITSMTAFITDGKRTNIRLDDSGDDEFALIASSFNKMSDNIDKYTEDISRMIGDEQRQKADLYYASRIQKGFLASPLASTQDYEISAKMTPAKDIGGDLYDYLDLGNDHLLLTVADVSGKGFTASFSMAVVLVLIRQFAKMGFSPAEILEKTNDVISERNPYMIFVTAFVGIFDKKTGTLTYSNGGHNPPYIIRKTSEELTGARNLLLGLYKNEKYIQETTHLDEGDILFLFTDGVNEAINKSNLLFGEKRLKDVLNGFRSTHKENLVEYVYDKVIDFANGAQQSDDITMLAFTVKKHNSIELPPYTEEFDSIKEIILKSNLPRSFQLSLCVAAEEIFINICSYAYSEEEKKTKRVRFTFEHFDRIVMKFEDNGIAYNPTDEIINADDYDPDKMIGGLGKLIAFTIADEVSYKNINGVNTLTITKYLLEDKNDNYKKQ